ncbi:MAG TPA: TIGR03560 family F420-dependent LLM class oxidoreductase [Conexibacter sp.]|jgi:F420-dependent oxidoreductase-like protein|nr:TIGR03560 family F420-dependent LLM class oxidoreductase [Conexibacter sp.]
MRVCLMIEGQESVSWDEWVALAQTCEAHGLDGLFRSDHYLSVVNDFERGSLDAWTTLAGLAAVTSTLRLGTLVSPATFRHPTVLAKSVVTVDHISRGRVELGIGAGWHEPEHTRLGFPFPPTRERIDALAEQLEVIHRSWGDEPFTFTGEHFELVDADPRPKPVQRPHPPVIVGGSAGPRSVTLAARWADEYNTVFATPDECRERRARVAEACEREGREPLPFSVMTGVLIGADRDDLHERARRLAVLRGERLPGGDAAAYVAALPSSWIAGTVGDAVVQLRALEEAGVERVMLQHLLHTDLEFVALLGEQVAPALR